MADVVYLAIVVGFFAICVLYVNWCDRIIGADQSSSVDATSFAAGGDSATEPADAERAQPTNTGREGVAA